MHLPWKGRTASGRDERVERKTRDRASRVRRQNRPGRPDRILQRRSTSLLGLADVHGTPLTRHIVTRAMPLTAKGSDWREGWDLGGQFFEVSVEVAESLPIDLALPYGFT